MTTLQKKKADGIRKWIFRSLYLLGIGIVAVTEVVAIAMTQEGDTLSENVWMVLEKAGNGPGGGFIIPAAFIAFAGFQVWLIPHFFRYVMKKI